MFLKWLNINPKLLKMWMQPNEVCEQMHMLRMVAVSGKSSASMNNKGGWEALGDLHSEG